MKRTMEPPGAQPPRRTPPTSWIPQVIIAAAAVAVIVGAYGSWGALSAVDEQADVTQATRHGLAVLGGLILVSTTIPRFRLQVTSAAAVLLVVAGLFTYGEWRYEQTQAFRYDATASRWGMITIFVGCAVGTLAAVAEVTARITGPSRSGPSE